MSNMKAAVAQAGAGAPYNPGLVGPAAPGGDMLMMAPSPDFSIQKDHAGDPKRGVAHPASAMMPVAAEGDSGFLEPMPIMGVAPAARLDPSGSSGRSFSDFVNSLMPPPQRQTASRAFPFGRR